jgi:hypothetical protein
VEYLDSNISVKCRVPKYLKAQLEIYFANKEENESMLSTDDMSLYDIGDELVNGSDPKALQQPSDFDNEV